SQQPYLQSEETGGWHHYRLIGRQVLVEPIGIQEPFDYNPVMSDQALLRFTDEESCGRAEEVLQSYRLQGKPVFLFHRTGASVMIQCLWTKALPENVEFVLEGNGRRIPFLDVFYSMDVVKSGFHHPDGMLWIHRPTHEHAVHTQKVSIRTIAPLVLKHF